MGYAEGTDECVGVRPCPVWTCGESVVLGSGARMAVYIDGATRSTTGREDRRRGARAAVLEGRMGRYVAHEVVPYVDMHA